MKFRLGITGGIGSGKSYISHLLRREFGIPVYDCDTEAKRLNNEDPEIRRGLVALAGPEVYQQDGLLCKSVLAQYLFASKEHADQVNAVVHPAVLRDFQQWTERQESPIVGMESAILYECGLTNSVDKVLLVEASVEKRIERAMRRDGAAREQVEARIARQQAGNFHQLADFVVLNDGTSDEELIKELNKILLNINKEKTC